MFSSAGCGKMSSSRRNKRDSSSSCADRRTPKARDGRTTDWLSVTWLSVTWRRSPRTGAARTSRGTKLPQHPIARCYSYCSRPRSTSMCASASCSPRPPMLLPPSAKLPCPHRHCQDNSSPPHRQSSDNQQDEELLAEATHRPTDNKSCSPFLPPVPAQQRELLTTYSNRRYPNRFSRTRTNRCLSSNRPACPRRPAAPAARGSAQVRHGRARPEVVGQAPIALPAMRGSPPLPIASA